ncbi:G protein-coupled receptor 161-like [Diaphorina citri]|uniref:G protein-coupled receptor 161-like n=1 Tax=Diaphorina citri TaxID=121845 RepID=A0A3Q0IUY5_DIACI|nr:G protein-coupled receptor 161-like [Diaphorina citri]
MGIGKNNPYVTPTLEEWDLNPSHSNDTLGDELDTYRIIDSYIPRYKCLVFMILIITETTDKRSLVKKEKLETTDITLLGLLLNVYILIVVLLSKELATGNKLLLIHLSLVNVLLSLLFLLVVVPHSLHYFSFLHPPGVRNRATSLCDLHGFLFSLLHSVAIWNVCGLNCDRYYAIAAPLHYSVLINQKKVGLCLAVTWFLCVLACIPPFFRVSPYSYDPDFASCVPDFKSGKLGTLWYSSFFIVSTFLLPVTVILICNIKVLMIARYHRHRIASAIFEVTLSAQVTITHQKNPFYNSLTLNKFLTRKSARTKPTFRYLRPSLTPLGILTKPAPLIRRSSEIGMETNNNSSSKSSNSAKKLKSLLSNRQISTSTSKLSLSTQETLSTQVLGAPNANRRMSNSVQNINKSFFHIR